MYIIYLQEEDMKKDSKYCKSQYNNVGLGQNNIVVFPTFLFCPNRFQ